MDVLYRRFTIAVWLSSLGAIALHLPMSLLSAPAIAQSALGLAPASTSQLKSETVDPEALWREINYLRANPNAYADWLETLRPYYDRAGVFSFPGEVPLQTTEGVTALEAAIAELRQMAPLPPVTLAAGLSQAATDHVQEVANSGYFSLQGSDGSTSRDRIERYGEPSGRVQEIIAQGLQDVPVIVAGLVIDDGNPSRSYREMLLDPNFQYLGVGCRPVHSLSLCVLNMAEQYQDDTRLAIAPPPQASSTRAAASDMAPPPTVSAENPFTVALTPSVLATLTTEMIAETNLLRSDPSGYADKLIALRPYYDGQLLEVPGHPIIETVEGVAALEEAIADLQTTQPLPTLTPLSGLNSAAAEHADGLGTQGLVGHIGVDGSNPGDRMTRYGSFAPGSAWGENISYGPPTLAEWHVIQLLVDDNVPNRSHRAALLNPVYRYTGAACAPHPVFRIVCVLSYAENYESLTESEQAKGDRRAHPKPFLP